MLLRPEQGTIAYHLGWAGFAFAFGLANWSRWQLVTSLAWYTSATGVFLERSWMAGNVRWDETTEIPLMLLLALMMVWHVRRRQAALVHVTRPAESEAASPDREPFSTVESARIGRHLQPRIGRHLQPNLPAPQGEQRYIDAGGVQLDLHRRRATTANGPVSLTGREFALLAHLMRRTNDVCSREELLHDIWDNAFDPGSNVVDVCVGRLRSKLQPTPPIETVRGAGYCFYDE